VNQNVHALSGLPRNMAPGPPVGTRRRWQSLSPHSCASIVWGRSRRRRPETRQVIECEARYSTPLAMTIGARGRGSRRRRRAANAVGLLSRRVGRAVLAIRIFEPPNFWAIVGGGRQLLARNAAEPR